MVKIIFSLLLFNLHPFHISVTDIEFDQDTKSLEIAQKIFIDDFEEVLRGLGHQNVDLVAKSRKVVNDQLVKDYLLKNFEVIANGKSTGYTFLGSQIEEDAIWCYMEIPKTKKLKSISIRNTILTDRFEDQMNLVHVKREGKIKSMRLTRNNPQENFDYQ